MKLTLFNASYLATAPVWAAILAFKMRDLRRKGWTTPALWALCLSVLAATLSSISAAPANNTLLHQLTGIVHFAVPWCYSWATLYAGSTLATVLLWRYPPARAWRSVRWIILGYSTTIVTLIALFVASYDTTRADERLTDWDIHYATTHPTVSAFMLAYITAMTVGTTAQAYQCWSASRAVRATGRVWTARTLRWFAIVPLWPLASVLVKFVVLITLWCGTTHLAPIGAAAPAISVLGSIPMAIAILLPSWGPRLARLRDSIVAWRRYHQLRPLLNVVRQTHPTSALPDRRQDVHRRLHRAVVELNDWQLALAPHRDSRVGRRAERLACEAGLTGAALTATITAAQLKAAAHYQHHDHPVGEDIPADEDQVRDGDPAEEQAAWARVARAYHSRIVDRAVASVLTETAAPLTAGHGDAAG
ncbi:hypothetical protein GCM10012275_43280 [Longimycelium tulufanense]|uniref:DUF6545 domain-containing protein n=1 Tax=Longimycelium tulufanense TaxID=907463 RepID=A0A8J3FWP1_9PSEU|nr:MAB_1171c family putative transporter [Longimycelium tulufanense]GGM68063.1 hypothetical protein GCM10012275_43280 [Longimycelium tulufanense]